METLPSTSSPALSPNEAARRVGVSVRAPRLFEGRVPTTPASSLRKPFTVAAVPFVAIIANRAYMAVRPEEL